MSVEHLDKIYSALDVVMVVSSELVSLARAFERIGNASVAEELFGYANDLREVKATIFSSVGDLTHQIFVDAQESSNNMLRAALASVFVGMDEKNG